MVKVEILQQKTYNFLWIDDKLWMWDIPAEREAQKALAYYAYGNVLVAGYGLGIVQRFLIQNPNVDSVLTLELYPEVITGVKEVYGCLYGDVTICDFYDFVSNQKFDCVIGDVWEDIVESSLEDYKKFKEKALTLVNLEGKILAWGGDFFENLIQK